MKRINNIKVPATKPYFFSNDKKFIIKKFKNILSGKSFLSMGQYGDLFEKKFSKFVGTRYAVACNSGTSALELICRGLSLENSEIIVPSNTFIASVNAILNSGAKPIFADCADDMCLSFESIKKKITSNTSAIMIVHIGGIISSDIDKIYQYCKKKKIYLIEDAAQAHGSFLNNKKAGSFGEAAAFSFFSTKVMTTGEGGMVTTNNYKLVKKMKSLREFGKVKMGILTNYHTNIGYNWRLGEVCSLMGLTQLKKIKELIKWREKISKYYYKHLNRIKQVDIITPIRKGHNYYKFIIYLKGINRKIVHNNLKKKNVHLSGYVYELPLHKQPVFKKYNKLKLKNTEKYCKNHICLPLFYGMTIKQASFVVTQLKKLLQ